MTVDVTWLTRGSRLVAETPAGRFSITPNRDKWLVWGPAYGQPPIIVTTSSERAKELAAAEISACIERSGRQ